MKTSNEFENIYWNRNCEVLGIDEAGRGPLAGPLVVAGVAFPIGYVNDEIYDSKKLSSKKREELFEIIKKEASFYAIEIVQPATIDALNILEATRNAMSKIACKYCGEIVLTDAMKLYIDKEVIDIVKGDQKSINIAAGSILAKVTRDRMMLQYDKLYPEYNFKKNKGYPTKEHLEAIKQYGITEIHRKSYKPVFMAMQTSLFD